MKTQRLYAFWDYDAKGGLGRYEPVLGAEVERFGSGGAVFPKGYGGHCFRPILILPLDEGEKLHASLRKVFASHERDATEATKLAPALKAAL